MSNLSLYPDYDVIRELKIEQAEDEAALEYSWLKDFTYPWLAQLLYSEIDEPKYMSYDAMAEEFDATKREIKKAVLRLRQQGFPITVFRNGIRMKKEMM